MGQRQCETDGDDVRCVTGAYAELRTYTSAVQGPHTIAKTFNCNYLTGRVPNLVSFDAVNVNALQRRPVKALLKERMLPLFTWVTKGPQEHPGSPVSFLRRCGHASSSWKVNRHDEPPVRQRSDSRLASALGIGGAPVLLGTKT